MMRLYSTSTGDLLDRFPLLVLHPVATVGFHVRKGDYLRVPTGYLRVEKKIPVEFVDFEVQGEFLETRHIWLMRGERVIYHLPGQDACLVYRPKK